MIFTETKLKGSFIVELEKFQDERGFFARIWDKNLFEEKGLNPNISQGSISFNLKKGTFRGMHYQIPPYDEDKLIRCSKGKIFDIIVDIRPSSSTYKQWEGFDLSSENNKMLYIPKGFAHGFQTLVDNTEVTYQISQDYMPDYSRGFKWNDPSFKIKLPLEISIISKKDLSYKFFTEKKVNENG
ncbi:dTDP-4-dehydrorhamnose 3,5-epimerase [Candidatus Nitrosopumilus sp. SW]|uniref:dTDP-4-dehydrorhamnose 3,5-epimerase n=1 Tax=Candidatus Nitrosopumilus sp. SW TaxID=2508726 RepID=UPI00114E9553|nr:dTDP-4-dehydrorhamnose 3,5-epimerase [Candidatus Nitrosopumilus sp. SW]QDI88774.1 dTDP-4-dehydrorhamnose 3,5-epimerase [Candidatus Nitrosopumilus sp. SW]